MFQSPSLRGSGRFTSPDVPWVYFLEVSIPFIAGQWSLPRSSASARAAASACFNPLHCGAVVASSPKGLTSPDAPQVSIPFIAGQWSLHYFIHTPIMMPDGFQSPSLRGSGRFAGADLAESRVDIVFQSPSLRGSGRFPKRGPAPKSRLVFQSPSLRGSGRFPKRGQGGPPHAHGFNPLHCGAVVAS